MKTIHFYQGHFLKFFYSCTKSEQRQLAYTLDFASKIELEVLFDTGVLRKIENVDGLYELRAEISGQILSVLCFTDKQQLVIVTSLKHEQESLDPQIVEKALRMKHEYFGEVFTTSTNHSMPLGVLQMIRQRTGKIVKFITTIFP